MKEFVDRFNQKKLQTYNLDETVTITAFYSGVQHIKCTASFHKNRPATLIELSKRVGKYINTEEFLKSKISGFGDDKPIKAKRKQEGSNQNWEKKPK